MLGVILAAPAGTRLSLFCDALQGAGWEISGDAEERVVIESGSKHAYIARADRVADELEEQDTMRILRLVSNPVFFTVEFNDPQFAKQILIRIASCCNIAIDNEHGDILPGTEFVRRLKRNPDWDLT